MNTALIPAIITIILDQFTKFYIEGHEALHNVTVIPGFFHIAFVRNTGMAWSLLSGQTGILALASAVAIGVMIWYLLTHKCSTLTKISLGLMLGGAAGNMIDRLFIGNVRDFLDFYIFHYDFPVFNIADSALTIGVILLILASIIDEKKKEKA
ncbi:MAG: signal peptidase II [Erysipelotrichaceae bacterium]|nr:signal peptidase II [Erysipelotrichaceae bacterium]